MPQNRVRLCTLGFDSSRAFRVLHLNIEVLENPLQECRGNSKIILPPSSRVSPPAVPPLHKFEGTHGVRFAWGNTRHSHRKVSSPCYITRSRAKKATLARSLVLSVKFGARYGRRLAAPRPLKVFQKIKIYQKKWFFQEYFIKNMAIDNKVLKI